MTKKVLAQRKKHEHTHTHTHDQLFQFEEDEMVACECDIYVWQIYSKNLDVLLSMLLDTISFEFHFKCEWHFLQEISRQLEMISDGLFSKLH